MSSSKLYSSEVYVLLCSTVVTHRGRRRGTWNFSVNYVTICKSMMVLSPTKNSQLIFLIQYYLFLYLLTYWSVWNWECASTTLHFWTSEDNFQESFLSFYPVGPRDWTQVVRLGSRCFWDAEPTHFLQCLLHMILVCVSLRESLET